MITLPSWAPSYQEEVLTAKLHEEFCPQHKRGAPLLPPEGAGWCNFYASGGMYPDWKNADRQIWVQAARATLQGRGDEALDEIQKGFETRMKQKPIVLSSYEVGNAVIMALWHGTIMGLLLGGGLVLLCTFLDWAFSLGQFRP